MPRLAANVSRLWAELPYLDRFDAAAQAGFEGVAAPFPYEMPAKDTQRAALRAALPLVHLAAPPPNYTGGPRGFAAVPEDAARFRYDLRRAVRYCTALRVPLLQIMAGEAEGPEARACLVDNLRHAVSQLPEGVTLTLQPQDQPGAFLRDFDLAAEIIAEVESARLGLQLHSLHAQSLHGDAVAVMRKHGAIVRHIQIADCPGGGAPGTGRVDFRAFLAEAASLGVPWIVADYETGGATEKTLDWMRAQA